MSDPSGGEARGASRGPGHGPEGAPGPSPGATPERLDAVVVQADELDDEPRAWLAERVTLRTAPAPEALPALLADADALVVRTYTRVTDELLARAPRLRVVARAGVGLDNIDLPSCARRGIAVVHTPDANTQAVAEYVLALALDALRPRLFLSEVLHDGEWRRVRRELLATRQLSECTLGIVGLGRVGARVARVFGALGTRVVYHDLLDIPPERRAGATPTPLDELLDASDIVSVHVDERPANRGLCGERFFGALRPDVVFINTSRGFVVDAQACAEFFIANPRAQALLDVHEPEPIAPTYALLDIRNVHLSPHIAAATRAAQLAMSWVVRDVVEVLSGRAARFPAPVR